MCRLMASCSLSSARRDRNRRRPSKDKAAADTDTTIGTTKLNRRIDFPYIADCTCSARTDSTIGRIRLFAEEVRMICLAKSKKQQPAGRNQLNRGIHHDDWRLEGCRRRGRKTTDSVLSATRLFIGDRRGGHENRVETWFAVTKHFIDVNQISRSNVAQLQRAHPICHPTPAASLTGWRARSH
jgi:hypothetical protein